MEIIYRPLERWDRRVNAFRLHSPFRANYSDTLDLLERELRMLKARRAVVELAIGEGDLRLDGQIRASAKPSHPGVTLSFDSKHGPLKYTADKFATWVENLRAIALGLEALRKVDRYGMTSSGEQYTGWKALPAGDDDTKWGHDLIEHYGGVTQALKETHPDKGGDPDAFRAVMAAREQLQR